MKRLQFFISALWFVPMAASLLQLKPAHAQPEPAKLVAAGSEISFTTRQMGVPVEGKFGSFSARIALDPKAPQGGSVGLTIDTGSARFGAAVLDSEVSKPTWLSSVKFPQASFESTQIKALGSGKFEVGGKLSIKGSVRDVAVPVQLSQSGASSTATGTFTIKRTQFKVGENEWADTSLLADEVIVKFKLQLTGLAPL
jgi:polyisoprenoid-binding protein YceI